MLFFIKKKRYSHYCKATTGIYLNHWNQKVKVAHIIFIAIIFEQ